MGSSSSFAKEREPITTFEIRVATTLADFSELWPRTDHSASMYSYAFQCADFLEVWCDTIGKARRTRTLFVAIFDRNRQPILLLPLGIEQRFGVRILRFIDGGVSDYNAPVVFAPGRSWEPQALHQLWREIVKALPRFDVAIFDKMPADIFGIPNPFVGFNVVPYSPSGYLVNITGSWEEYAKRLPQKRRTRDKRRSLSNLGDLHLTIAKTPDDRQRILQAMMQQKTRRYLETRGVDGFDRLGYRQYYTEMTKRFTWPGPVFIAALELDSKILSAIWSFLVNGRFYYMVPSFEGDEWRRFSPGRLLLEDLVKWSFDNGVSVFDLGIGDEGYKLGFSDQKLPLFQIDIPVTFVGRVYEFGKNTKAWKLLKSLGGHTIRRLQNGYPRPATT